MSGRSCVALCAALAASTWSCAIVGEDYVRPELSTTSAWAAAGEAGAVAAAPKDLGRWWTALEDEDLDALVDEALAGSLDLASAAQRVRQAAALQRRAVGERFPDVNGTGSYSRTRVSANTFPPFGQQTFDLYSIGLEFGWEIDLWGRVTRIIEAADADLAASIEDLRDVQALVVASVASAYLDVRTGQARLAVALQNVEIQRASLELTETRFDAGAAPALDVAQARTNLSNTEADVPVIRAELRADELQLAVLLGRDPSTFVGALEDEGEIPAPPQTFGVGVPADVLRQRPDVRSAEQRLVSEVARVGIEEADLYPRFDLVGSIGYESTDSGRLFQADSGFFGFGPTLFWNLFDGGRERADIEAQRAAAEVALLDYRQSVLEAVEEVEREVYGLARDRERVESLRVAVDAARRSADLSRQLYLEGRSDFQNVLDAERSLFAAEDSLILGRASVTRTYIALQRALGGGWQPEETGEETP
ncbi:MAG: efflux transporter outer membrane subunit [Planctomycetota bacterium]